MLVAQVFALALVLSVCHLFVWGLSCPAGISLLQCGSSLTLRKVAKLELFHTSRPHVQYSWSPFNSRAVSCWTSVLHRTCEATRPVRLACCSISSELLQFRLSPRTHASLGVACRALVATAAWFGFTSRRRSSSHRVVAVGAAGRNRRSRSVPTSERADQQHGYKAKKRNLAYREAKRAPDKAAPDLGNRPTARATYEKVPKSEVPLKSRWKQIRAPPSPWKEGDPLEIRFRDVSWRPTVASAGENGRASTKNVLESVSWVLKGPQKVGLIGANGCGKSTQLLMIQGLVQPSDGRVEKYPSNMNIAYMQQEANLDGDMTVLGELQSVFGDRDLEDIDSDLDLCASHDALDEMTKLLDERATAEKHQLEVENLIPKLGLSDRREEPIVKLSGGWQMRVALGKIMLRKPDLVLLDEPTNHIDLETVEFMENFLRSQEVAMVIASHDRYFLNQVCTGIVEVYKGRAEYFKGNYLSYLKARDTSLAREWQIHVRHMERIQVIEKQITKLQARLILDKAKMKREELERLQATIPPKPEVNEIKGFRFLSKATDEKELEENSDGGVKDSFAKAEEGPCPPEKDGASAEQTVYGHDDDVALEVQDLRVSYGTKPVLNGLSFSVSIGEKVAIVGSNGCGKSTLIRAIVGELDNEADFDGNIASTLGGVAYFPQRLAEEFNYAEMSVKDALYFSCSARDINNAGGLDAVLRRLRLGGVTKEQPVCSLSGGEKARVAFAQYLLQPASLLIFDEPTNHLDIPTRELLEDALKAFDGAALVVSHDRFFLREFATRVIEIEDGKLRDYASWDEYSAAAPSQWKTATEAEVDFVKQDAQAAIIWSHKKMTRLKKREGNVGLRRLSTRAEEYIPEVVEDAKREGKEEKAVSELISQGIDPSLLGPHAPVEPEYVE